MVPRINTSKNIARAINYNEQKVQQGKAAIILASGFLKNADQLSFNDKLRHFEQLNALNEKVVTNTLHVSLNFDAADALPTEKLQAIAQSYMARIGFGRQPYLVYQHYDAGHQHIHIVSTNIRSDGKRISMHNLGKNQSEKARKIIETQFNLVKADSRHQTDADRIIPVNAQKLQYGKSETKRAITNVLDVVVKQYKFTSLPELNAVLKSYNVTADRGTRDSRTYQKGGLVYRVLDGHGNKVGTPIKASSIYSKPTLARLEERFVQNMVDRQPHAKRVKTTIDWCFLKKKEGSLEELTKALSKEGITLVLWKNTEGRIYGTTYVDHKTKCAFNGSDLGKGYAAKGLEDKMSPATTRQVLSVPEQQQETAGRSSCPPVQPETLPAACSHAPETSNQSRPLTTEPLASSPFELHITHKRRKKRKRISH